MAHPHSNLVRQIDNIEVSVASLAALTGVVTPSKIDASREQGFRTLMQRGIIQLHGTGAGSAVAGPLAIGFTQADLSLTEIEEAIENDPQDQTEEPANEQARRKIFWLGFISTEDKSLSTIPVRTSHRLSILEGSALSYFAYNTDVATAISASTQVKFFIEHLGVWLRD